MIAWFLVLVGYSKYSEDIVDRWVEDTREREAAFYRQWNVDHVPSPPPSPGDVYLETGGKRLEDEEVFPVSNTVRLAAVATADGVPTEVTLQRKSEQLPLRPDATGFYTISASSPESVELDAASGPYHRAYTIHFVEMAQIERIPGLLDEIKRFTSNPPGWTREQFDAFRSRLRDLLQESAVPQSFANGLAEYFLAVQSEANQELAFERRLETAYIMLRKFAPFSDIAAVITEYFRYRVNLFGTAVMGSRTAGLPLNAIRAFFLGVVSASPDSLVGNRAIELVIAEAEYCCIEAVRAMLRNDPETALGLTSIARKVQGELQDPLREERLRIIEARAHVALAAAPKARALYQRLLNSMCESFRNEAVNFLRK